MEVKERFFKVRKKLYKKEKVTQQRKRHAAKKIHAVKKIKRYDFSAPLK